MLLPRKLLACLAFLLAAAPPSEALWSDVAPTDSLWRIASQAKVFLVRTGDARLDDGIEQGFVTAWPAGSWSWIPDSGIAKMVEDSTVLLFRLVEPRSPHRRTRERDCQKLTGVERRICLDEQAAGRFRLEIGGKKLGRRNGTMLLEAPSQTRRMLLGDAFVVDLPKDFALVLQAVRDSAYPDGGAFPGTKYWARETVARDRRGLLQADTLWILEEQLGQGGIASIAKVAPGPVHAVAAAELETMMGTSRSGAYLEAGLLPGASRQLRVRNLSSGELMLIDDVQGSPGRSDTLLKVEDFRRLAHRASGDELRPFVMVSAGPELSFGGLMGMVFTGGYEFRRGLWGLAGWANWSGRPTNVPDFERDHLLVGIRYTPFLAWENPGLGSPRWLRSRLAIGARYWQPYGESDSTDVEEWLDKVYPHITLDVDLLGDLWYLGASPEFWFGTNTVRKYTTVIRGKNRVQVADWADHIEGGWSFRAGIQYGFAGWRPGVGWRTAKQSAELKARR